MTEYDINRISTHLIDFVVIAQFSFTRRNVENFANDVPQCEAADARFSLPPEQRSNPTYHCVLVIT